MLERRTVDPKTLELLEELMLLPELQDFCLAGGTALALQTGHRFSVDLDLFTIYDFNAEKLASDLSRRFDVESAAYSGNTLNLSIAVGASGAAVEVDLLKFSYPLLKPVVIEGNIRMLSMEDIAAMKLSAIAGRGSKKDFYDIYYLLMKFDLKELLGFFRSKFPSTNTFQIVKSLTYFDDADVEPDPITFEPVEWELVKRAITEKLEKYLYSV
jgi:hypothetical protein